MPSSSIPAFYRICFTIVDPAICVASAYGYIFSPHYILTQFTPSPLQPLPLETQVLTDTMAGVFMCLALLFGYLLRIKPNDLTTWRAVQLGTLMIDFAILGGMARALTLSNRLDVRVWTQGELGSIISIIFVALIRLAFFFGVGLGGGQRVGEEAHLKKI